MIVGWMVFLPSIGDDDSNIEEDYMSWKEQFWTDVCKIYGVEKSEDNLE